MQERVERIDIELWDPGAPLPHILAGASTTYVVCYPALIDPDAHKDAALGTATPMSRESRPGTDDPEGAILVLELRGCRDTRFGGPNDETIQGHRLWAKGLRPYRAHEVHGSAWIEDAIAVNSVHPRHSDAPFRALHHYVLTFHDDMLEALAESLTANIERGTLRSVLCGLSERLTAGSP